MVEGSAVSREFLACGNGKRTTAAISGRISNVLSDRQKQDAKTYKAAANSIS